MDTIVALASGHGASGVAVVRVSGPQADAVCRNMTGVLGDGRRADFCVIKTQAGEILDHGIVIRYPAPNSFTGESVVEFQVHGSIAVVNALLAEIASFPDVRIAEPGEFTRRAHANGKMNLMEVEGLGDLIVAETELQRRQAFHAYSGAASASIDRLKVPLVRAAALLEATIDFADEEIPEDVVPEVVSLLEYAQASIGEELDKQKFAERMRHGFEVAIVGEPNVGKSTLLNYLAGRDAAITSEIAGTTRDVIEVRMDLDGMPVTLLDTAGLRETEDPVEKMGVELARSRAEQADIRVWLVSKDHELNLVEYGPDDIIVHAKADLNGSSERSVSGATGAGVQDLISQVREALGKKMSGLGALSRERHVSAFREAEVELERATSLILQGEDFFDLASEHVRRAIRRLDFVVGRVNVENLLDVIFSSFCLGK